MVALCEALSGWLPATVTSSEPQDPVATLAQVQSGRWGSEMHTSLPAQQLHPGRAGQWLLDGVLEGRGPQLQVASGTASDLSWRPGGFSTIRVGLGLCISVSGPLGVSVGGRRVRPGSCLQWPGALALQICPHGPSTWTLGPRWEPRAWRVGAPPRGLRLVLAAPACRCQPGPTMLGTQAGGTSPCRPLKATGGTGALSGKGQVHTPERFSGSVP